MFAVPVAMPDTIPVVDPMVAIDVFPLLQVPPDSALLSVLVDPRQTLVVPVIGDGVGLTVTAVVE